MQFLKRHSWTIGVAVIVLGLIYLDRDEVEKPVWLAKTVRAIWSVVGEISHQLTWYEALPDCADDEVQTLAVKLARQIITPRLPRDVPLPFVLEQIQLDSVIDRGIDDADIQHCWANLYAPRSSGTVSRHNVGAITYIVADDASDSSQYVVRVTLESLNLQPAN